MSDDTTYSVIGIKFEELQKLQEENDKLKSVLKFVADEENFNENFYSYGYASRSDYLKESGNRARELLKKLEE